MKSKQHEDLASWTADFTTFLASKFTSIRLWDKIEQEMEDEFKGEKRCETTCEDFAERMKRRKLEEENRAKERQKKTVRKVMALCEIEKADPLVTHLPRRIPTAR